MSGPNGEQEEIEVPVWNGTIANIVLMSLGKILAFFLSLFIPAYNILGPNMVSFDNSTMFHRYMGRSGRFSLC